MLNTLPKVGVGTHKIYRIENDEEFGPYYAAWQGNTVLRDLFSKCDPINHPTPDEDPGIPLCDVRDDDFERCFIYGFANMEQVNKWFTPEELKVMQEHGFFLREIEVKEIVYTSEHQVVAIRRETYEEAYRNYDMHWRRSLGCDLKPERDEIESRHDRKMYRRKKSKSKYNLQEGR